MNNTLHNFAEGLDEESSKRYKEKLCLIGIAISYIDEALNVDRDHLFCVSGGNK